MREDEFVLTAERKLQTDLRRMRNAAALARRYRFMLGDMERAAKCARVADAARVVVMLEIERLCR